VKNGRIIARGTNLVTTSNDPTAHAEIVAIRKACKKLSDFRLSGCEIYASCDPCPMCLSAIYWSRADKLFFAGNREDAARAGFDDSYIAKQLRRHPSRRALPSVQILRRPALEAFRHWKNKIDKDPY